MRTCGSRSFPVLPDIHPRTKGWFQQKSQPGNQLYIYICVYINVKVMHIYIYVYYMYEKILYADHTGSVQASLPTASHFVPEAFDKTGTASYMERAG